MDYVAEQLETVQPAVKEKQKLLEGERESQHTHILTGYLSDQMVWLTWVTTQPADSSLLYHVSG